MPDEREYELKFSIAPDAVPALTSHPTFALGRSAPTSATLVSTYFDTPDQTLRRHDLTLRIRDKNGAKVETVKQTNASTLDRGEWEFQTDDIVPSLERLQETPLGALMHEVDLKDRIAPVFTVTVERTTKMLRWGDSDIEVAIDRGEVEADGRHIPISEIELELKQGRPTDLFDLASHLVHDVALTLSLVSKSERGFRLLDRTWGHPVKAARPVLDADMTQVAAVQTLLEACLHDLLLNLAAFAPGGDIEAVHRGRVALRRLRAAMTLFESRTEDAKREPLRLELKWLSDLLGVARDCDVFQSEIFDPAAEDPAILGARDLADHMRQKQRNAHAALAEGLRSPRWRRLLSDLIAWIADGAWITHHAAADPSAPEETLADFARQRLRSRWRSLVRKGRGLGELPPHERHLIRIRAKKLRYALEFFEEVPGVGKGSKSYKSLQRGLEELQASLGLLHDHDAKHDLLHAECLGWDPANAAGPRIMFAAGVLSGAAPDTDMVLKKATAAFKIIRDSDPFRSDLTPR
ncbi:CYTH and CHAD domain-containing protein [Lichenihabitans psoromatis]|uniref:CYTH and CHAD domain-containing protein n=1 Tax=Lichenihabitans psoromatis TaxID=2528642 RepID=UPI0013F152DB|nr:CYTH and CHAD domain-containing protein [Lichenihabitans psoromatis]